MSRYRGGAGRLSPNGERRLRAPRGQRHFRWRDFELRQLRARIVRVRELLMNWCSPARPWPLQLLGRRLVIGQEGKSVQQPYQRSIPLHRPRCGAQRGKRALHHPQPS
jgi:hypothetical protein